MKEKNENLPAKLNMPPEQLTEAAIMAYFRKEISRQQYCQSLQRIDNIKPTKDNLPICHQDVKAIKGSINVFLESAKEVGTPYFKAHKLILKCANDVVAPMLTKLSGIEAVIKTINNEVLADLAKQEAERLRVERIRKTMAEFINNCTAFIGTATKDTQIVNVQKRIGAEKSKKNFYAEFYEEFVAKCDALNPLINERKEQIRKSDELSIAAAKALLNDDAEAAIEIKEQQEQLESDMEENILRLQEAAFDQISNEIPVVVPETTNEALAGRNYWRWEVVDADKVYKKHRDWIILEPNKESLDKFMSENREQWKKDGKAEIVLDGIKFFIKKFL